MKTFNPPNHDNKTLPNTEIYQNPAKITPEEIFKALSSFPNRSSGGMDGLRTQQLKDLCQKLNGDNGFKLQEFLAKFIYLFIYHYNKREKKNTLIHIREMKREEQWVTLSFQAKFHRSSCLTFGQSTRMTFII
uniref:Reverse transcriptase domain-containing protein n=1 Tax=Photinus pyralis TaxID=7054 RepID=A0A1Y1LMW3_PHOPY